MFVHGEPVNAQAQLVAEAVTAFNENNAQSATRFPSVSHLTHFVSSLTLLL